MTIKILEDRNFLMLFRGLLLCGFVIAMAYTDNVEAAPPPPDNNPRRVAANVTIDNDRIMVGDKVRISFFENLILFPNKKSDAATKLSALNSFYERADLSGEFEVTRNGRISHPLLGLIHAKGLQLYELERELKKAFIEKTKKDISIRAIFSMRPPIYVSGLVSNPGAYKYVQGMTVAQVVSLSSGLFRSAEKQHETNDIMQERARIRQYKQKLGLVLMRKARLEAHLIGKTIDGSSSRLIELIGNKRANALVKRENKLLQQLRQIKLRRKVAMLRTKKLAEEEIVLFKDQKKVILRQQKISEKNLLRHKKVYRSSTLRKSFKATDALTKVELKYLSLKNAELDVVSNKLKVQQKLVRFEQELASSDFDYVISMTKEIDSLEEQIIDYENVIDTANTSLYQMQVSLNNKQETLPGQSRAVKEIVYEITRRHENRLLKFVANTTSYVKPGDVLNIKFVPSHLGPLPMSGLDQTFGQ